MIKISIFRNQKSNIDRFSITGHSGYAEEGKDIICSAVSAVSGTAIIGIQQLLKSNLAIDTKDGYLDCKILKQNQKVQLILEVMILGLKDIEQQYKKFVTVIDEEV